MSAPSLMNMTGSAIGILFTIVLLAALVQGPAQAAGSSDRSGGKLGQWMAAKNHPETAAASALASIDAKAVDRELDALITDPSKKPQLSSGYRLKTLPSEGFVIYEDPSDHHPSLILNQKPRYDLILQVPHSGLETGTVAQAAFLMRELGARAILLSGMHRCAASTFSDCDGKTSVCGQSEPYRTSDAAHSADGLFQKMHERLTDAWPKSLVVQLHEMRPSEKGPLVILSSTAKIHGDDGPVSGLKAALRKHLKDKASVLSCHDEEDLKKGFRLLCGFTNVQGREIHGSPDPCDGNATRSSERFLHVEQDYEITSEPWYLDGFAAALEELAEASRRL